MSLDSNLYWLVPVSCVVFMTYLRQKGVVTAAIQKPCQLNHHWGGELRKTAMDTQFELLVSSEITVVIL